MSRGESSKEIGEGEGVRKGEGGESEEVAER